MRKERHALVAHSLGYRNVRSQEIIWGSKLGTQRRMKMPLSAGVLLPLNGEP